jgi:hypothetical protein
VVRIDPRNGERAVLASLNPGLDNLTFVGTRLFVSNFSGEITEILADGATRTVLAGGLNWPLDLAVGHNGDLYVADGTYLYVRPPAGGLRPMAMLFTPGYPGFLRGLAASAPGELIVTTSGGEVARYRPQDNETGVLADGFDQLYGVAVSPDGAAVVAELGEGRVLSIRSGQVEVLASGLRDPVGVEMSADGTCLVAEAGAGRVVRLTGSGVETVLGGLQRPQGIQVCGGRLYVVDADAKALIGVDLDSGVHSTIASGLPVGAPPGVAPKPLLGLPPFSGPQGPFAGIAAGSDGTLFVSADADGSVLALRQDRVS